MLLKIVSFIASILLLFISSTTLPAESDVLVEELVNLSENRTADEINGANGTKFFIQRPMAEKLTTVNASEFGLTEENEAVYEEMNLAAGV